MHKEEMIKFLESQLKYSSSRKPKISLQTRAHLIFQQELPHMAKAFDDNPNKNEIEEKKQ